MLENPPEATEDTVEPALAARRSRNSVAALVGLVAIVTAFLGIGWLHALQQAPFSPPDETAHVGYAQEIASGRLPEIETVPVVPTGANQWKAERSTAPDDRYLGVWVANHPPLHYAATTPLIWASRVLDHPDGGLVLLRLANVTFAATGIVFTFLLAREISGGDSRFALAAAALAALVPQAHASFSQGLNDGLAFAASTAMVWAGARCLARRSELRRADIGIVAVAAVVAFGARAVSMLVAIAVVGYVATAVFSVGDDRALRRRAVDAGRFAAFALAPAVAIFGWFYVRNWLVYGDIGASSHLLELFERSARGSWFEMFGRGDIWSAVFHGLFTPDTAWWRVDPVPGAGLLMVFAAIGVAVAFGTGRLVSGRGPGGPVVRWQLGLCLVVVALIALTVAQHVAGGGNPLARYALPAVGVLAVLAAVGAERIVPRWGPLAVVLLAGWWALRRLPIRVEDELVSRPRDGAEGAPGALRLLPLNDTYRWGSGALILVGVIVAAVVLVLLTVSSSTGAPGRSGDHTTTP